MSGEPEADLLFAEFLRATAGADDDADFALGVHVHGGEIDVGVLQSFRSGRDCERHDTADVLALFRVDPCGFVEILDLAGDLHGEFARIKARNALDAAFSRKDGAAERFIADAVRAYAAHAGDHNSFGHEWEIVTHRTQLPATLFLIESRYGARRLHIGAVLPNQVQLLQFRE